MAGKGFEISAALNASKFQRGVKDVEGALNEVAEALDDVAKDADKAGHKMGEEIADGAKDASRSVERLERSFKEMADASKRETQQTSQAVRKNITDDSGEAVKEWGDEAKQNVAETFSSFRGDAEDFVGILQDTFGGVISNLGPMGMAAGAAGALGIGLIMGELEKAKEAEQEFREQVAELAGQLIETGGEGAEAVQGIADRLKNIATETDKDAMSFDKLRAMAKDMNVDFADLAQAYVAGGGDLQSYLGKLDDLIAKEQKAYSESQKYSESAGLGTTLHGIELEKTRDKLQSVAETYQQAEKDAASWAESGAGAIQARAEQMEALQGELDESVSAWGEYVDSETGAIDPAAFIAGMAAKREAVANFNTNVQTISQQFGLTQQETQAILDQGLDFAPHLQSIIDSGMAEAYAGEVRASLSGGQSIIDGTPLSATITTKTDAQDAEKQLDDAATERTAPVKAAADTTAAAKTIDDVAAKPRTAKIVAAADTSTARQQLDNLTQKLTVTIQARVVDQRGVPVP